ncbi:MAG: two-component system sensor histidine kinase NtrB [bacterium]
MGGKDSENKQKPGILRQRAEERLRLHKGAQSRAYEADTQRLIQELQVHQIELQMQNEELQRIQLELEKSRQKYFDLFDLAPLGYLICNRYAIIQEANLTAATMLGVKRGRLLKQPLSKYIISKDQDIFYLHIKNLTKEQIQQNCELRMLKKKGLQFYAHLESRPINDDQGAMDQFRVLLIDVTDRKESEERIEKMVDERTKELVKTQVELEKAKRLSDIGLLAATVAHELRNPLGVIKIASYNIRKKIHNPLLDKHLDNIEQKISESDQIINNLLGYSRITMPHYQTINIKDILDECIRNKNNLCSGRQIAIVKEYTAIKNIVIEADPYQLKEIINNILDNACQSFAANKKGMIEIKAHLVDNKSIRISCTDNGGGIDNEYLEKVFEPFFTLKSKGTGLGLAICRQLASIHGGTIDIKSEKGKGTTVAVNLPTKKE